MLLDLKLIKNPEASKYLTVTSDIAEYVSEGGPRNFTYGSEAVMEAFGIYKNTTLDSETLTTILKGESLGTWKNGELGPGKPILKSQGDDRSHRGGWTFVVSDGKELSLTWALAKDDSAFVQAYDQARNDALKTLMDCIEDLLQSKNQRLKGEKIEALFHSFEHHEARSVDGSTPDPQRHNHIILDNVAWCESKKKFCAVETGAFFQAAKAQWLGQLYQCELAKNLRARGYSVDLEERELDRSGKKNQEKKTYKQAIVNSGIPDDMVEDYSKRTKAIDAFVKKNNLENTRENRQKASNETKEAKQELTLDQLKTSWVDQAKGKYGFTFNEASLKKSSIDPQKESSELVQRTQEFDAEIRSLYKEVFDGRKKSIEEADFIYLSLKVFGDIRDSNYKEHIERGKIKFKAEIELGQKFFSKTEPSHHGLLAVDDGDGNPIFMPSSCIAREIEFLERSKNQANPALGVAYDVPSYEVDAFVADYESKKGFKLTDNQKAAVYCMTSGGLSMIEGVAGAGKSTLAEVVKNIYEAKGNKLIGLSFTGAAADNLKDSTGIESHTIHSLLLNKSLMESIDYKTVLVVDEIGQCGIDVLNPLLKLAYEKGAKIIGLGDEEQLPSINNRGGMKVLKEAAGSYVFVNENRRQDKAINVGKEIGNLSRSGDMHGVIERLKSSEALKTTSTIDQAIEELAQEYLASKNEMCQKFILCETNQSAQKANDRVKALMVQSGLLGESFDLQVADADDQVHSKNFAIGERIVFTKNSKVGERSPFFSPKGRAMSVKNGTQATIVDIKFDRESNAIITANLGTDEKPRLIKWNLKDYNKIEAGFAITSYKSQGATKNDTFVLVEGSMVSNKQTVYVTLTRHKNKAIFRGTDEAVAQWELSGQKSVDQRLMSEKLLDVDAMNIERSARVLTSTDEILKERQAQQTHESKRLFEEALTFSSYQSPQQPTNSSNGHKKHQQDRGYGFSL